MYDGFSIPVILSYNYVVYDYHIVILYMINRQVNCSNYSKKRIRQTCQQTNSTIR